MGFMMLDWLWAQGQMMWAQDSVQHLAKGWIKRCSTEEETLSTSSCVGHP
jgi:hypothetical protein